MSIDANLNHKVKSKVILKEKRVFGFSKLIMAAAAFLADMRLEMDYVLRQIENRSTGSVPIVA